MPESERRRHVVQVRLNDAEAAGLEDVRGELPAGTFLRRLLTRFLARRRQGRR